MWITSILVLLLIAHIICNQQDPYGVSIINNNLDQTLNAQKVITVLFHSPSCEYSNTYKQLFLMAAIKLKQQQETFEINFAVVDCQLDIKICDKYNIGIFPTVLELHAEGDHKTKKVYEQQLLSRANIIFQKQLQVQNVERWLQDQPHYFVAILQEQGFQPETKLQKQNVLYLQNSELHRLLLGYTRGKVGCWIFQYDLANASLKKYTCGTGMNPNQIQLYTQKFKRGDLQEFIFTRESQNPKFDNEKILGYSQLVKLNDESSSQNRVILYDSDDCWYCRGVASAVSNVLKRIPHNIKFYRYLSDINEIPHSKTIMKLPYLQLWTGQKLHIYEGRFSEQSLREYINQKIQMKSFIDSQTSSEL